jgi:threonine dehydratase
VIHFDDCAIIAKKYTEDNGMVFIPPFDDHRIIEGQGTVGVEILEDLNYVDYLFLPIGGGGLVRRRWFLFQNLFAKNKDHRIGT